MAVDEISRVGLTEVDAGPDAGPDAGVPPVALLIFVHGLFGDPYKTWSVERPGTKAPKDRVFWPREFLRDVLPNVKIFTWSYDADVDGFFSAASQNTISQHANGLLADIADQIRNPDLQSLPIIFVVHSLGGVIVKDALTKSKETVGTRLKTVARATYGVVFPGTPHRGSRTASVGKIAYTIKKVWTKKPNLRLLQGPEPNSETLDRIGSSFSQFLLKQPVAIYSLKEEKETRKLIFSSIVVDADSAKIGDGKEEVHSIPASHTNMTKFPTRSDIGFKRVSAQLRRWVDDITGSSNVIFH